MFKKGKSGNPKGRPKGAKDRIKGTIAERIKEIIDYNLEGIQEDIDALEPKERVQFLLKLFEYAVPKAQSNEGEPMVMNLLQQTIHSDI